MEVPFVDLNKQYHNIKEEINSEVTKILESGFYVLGPKVKELEEKISGYVGVNHGIAVASGTEAIRLAINALGIGEGDEVITVSNTATPTVMAVSNAGAVPVFVDIEKETYNIDVSKIEDKITDKTKAILPVHLYGQVCNMERIKEIADRHNLFVIEDCAQSFGAEYNGKKAGSLGDVSCFSFFPTKNLGAYGDGGMILTNSDDVAEKLRMFRSYGEKEKYKSKFIGYNSRMDEIQASILLVKMKYINEWNKKRRDIAKKYSEGLKNVVIPREENGCGHVYHLYVVRTDKRDEMFKYLRSKDITSMIHYPNPIHFMEAYNFLGYKNGDLPITEEYSKKILTIPLYPEMSNEQVEYVIETVNSFGGD